MKNRKNSILALIISKRKRKMKFDKYNVNHG